MGYNKKILSQATAGLNKAKAPAKKKDRVINPIPLISNEGFKQGPPPEGTNYRIPSNTIINPTPYNILARASTGEERIIPAGDTNPETFDGAEYVDEFQLKKGGQKTNTKKYSRSLSATNKLFDKNPLFKKPKSKKKKIFDPNAKYYQHGGIPENYDATVAENNTAFLNSMMNSPLFVERYARMIGKPIEEVGEEAEAYRQQMIQNLKTVGMGDSNNPPSSYESINAAAYYKPPYDLEEYNSKMTEIQSMINSVPSKGKHNKELRSKYQSILDDYKNQADALNSFGHKLYFKNWDQANDLHERSHASTKGRDGIKGTYDYNYRDMSKPRSDSFSDNIEHSLWSSHYLKEDPKTGGEKYYTELTELKARKDVAAKKMAELGLYDPVNENFTEDHYKKLVDLMKNPDLDNNTKMQIRDIVIPFTQEDTIRMFNDIVQNNEQSTEQYAKKGGFKFQDGGQYLELDLTPEEINEYRKGGWIVEELPQAQKGRQRKNTYLPGAWANTAPDLIEPGQEAFPLPGQKLSQQEKWARQEATYPMFTEADLAWQDKVNRFDENMYNTAVQRFQLQIKNAITESEKNFAESSKYDKISPIISFKSQDITPEMEQAWRQEGFLPIKNKKTGQIDFYLQKQIANRIVYNGLRTDEIVNKLGIGDKEIIEKELGSFMKVADDVYKTGVTEKVLSNVIKKGVSIDQALKDLEKDGYGKVSDIKKQLGEESIKKIDDAVKQHYAFNPNYIPPYRTGTYAPGVSTDFGKVDTSVNLKDKWKDNDIITLARDKDFIDSFDINNFDVSSPNAKNNPAWNSQVVAKLRSGEWGWKPKTNELVKLSKSEAYKPLSIGRKSAAENLISQTKAPATGNPFTQMALSAFWDEQEALTNRAKDYIRLGVDEWQQKYAPSFQQMQERWQTGKTPVEISEEASYRPKRMFQDNQYYQYGFEQPVGVDPTTGETITRKVSPEKYAGQTVYMSPKESEKYNREMLGQNREQFMTSPIYYLPGTIASGALLGPGGLGRAALNYAPIKSLPWLNAGNALNAEFAYQAFKDDGFAEQAYNAALENDKEEALLNLGLTGLAAQPYAKGARTLYNISKGLNTPGSLQTIATNLPFSAAYKSPIGSELVLQNPTWSSATKEILPGLTSRLNRTLGPTLGEFKLYGRGTQPVVKNPNLLTGSTSAVNQIPGGRYAELPIGRKEYTLPPETVFTDSQLNNYASSAARDRVFPPYRPGYGFSTKGLNEIADAEFKTFSPGWQAQQEMSNLATYGKQPLLKPSDFATEREMEIDRLFYKNRQGVDPDSKDFSAFMKEAEEKGFTPDEVLKRMVTNLGNKVDPARQSQRGLLNQSKPFNLDTRNRDIIRQGNYRPFSKELNEFGSMGGKPPVSFGTSGEFDQYYWDQIKRHEDFLTGDYNLSPEQREKIQSKLNSLYQKGVKQGTQSLGFDLQNPWNYKPGLSGLSPNQYGGELPEAQDGGMYLELDDKVDILPQQQTGGITKALKAVSKLDDLLLPKQLSLFSDADFLTSSISPSVRNMSGFTMPQIENRLLPEYKNLTEEAFKNSVFSPSGKLHPAPQYARADLYNVFSNPKPQYSMPLNEYVNEFNSRLDILNDIIERNNMSGIPYEVTELTNDGFLRFNSPRGRSSFATRIQPGSFTRENLEEVIDPIYWRNIPGIEMSDTSYGVFGEIANPPRGTNSYRSLNEYLKQQQLGRIKSGFNAQSESGLKAWEKFVKNNEAHGYFDEPNRMYSIFRKEGGKL